MADIENFQPARKSVPAFTIIHAVTEDLPDGSPWPPAGGDLWCVVSRNDGLAKWRRIIPQQISELARIRADVDQQVGTLLKLFERQLRRADD
jgi:hypothetical protein